MKNFKKVLFVLLLAVLAPATAQTKKVAVVTFYADKRVGMSDLGLEGLADITSLQDNPNFNLQPLLDEYHTRFFGTYAKEFPFELLPETTVTENESYKNFKAQFPTDGSNESRFTTFAGYKAINSNWGRENEKEMIRIFSEADGVLFVYINFDFIKGFGIGGTSTVKMKAYTNIVLYNKKGEKVFTINENAQSKKTGVMVGGVPVIKPEKVLPMCQSALDELMKDLDKRLPKIISKTAKKL